MKVNPRYIKEYQKLIQSPGFYTPMDMAPGEYQLPLRQRALGKTFAQFQSFVKACNDGAKIQWHGHKWVAVDRKQWDEMQRKLNNPEIVTADESSVFKPGNFYDPMPFIKGKRS